jgi:S-adenosylmethionine:tRNA ribosyltransferase-isomerase
VLRTADLDFHLPEDLIAQVPAEPRDASRLMVLSRSDPAYCEHRRFRDLPAFLRPNDLLVFNTSSVLPARLEGRRADTGGHISGLFIAASAPERWTVMLKAGSRMRPGVRIVLHDCHDAPTPYMLELLNLQGMEWQAAVIDHATIKSPCRTPAPQVLEHIGSTPLPPYILGARKHAGRQVADERDRDWYQTVYADRAAPGSIAAPTAGLHFTPDLLHRLDEMRVARAGVILHVGAGTFKPVETELVEQHPMHSEWCHTPPATLHALRRAREHDGRIIPVGTTSVRTLESLPDPLAPDIEAQGVIRETRLLITPGFTFRYTDALITNFHLPRSTLLALVAARLPEGLPRLLDIYQRAIAERYRFFSYGDSMLILP